MADNVSLPASSGTVAADEVVDGTLGTVKVQYVKLMDGTLDGTTKATVGAGGLAVDTELPAAAALADATSNPTTPLVGGALHEWNGATWDRTQGNTLDGLQVWQRYPIWGDSLADGISALWTQSTANGGTVTTSGGEGLLKTSTATTGSSQIVGPVIPYRPGSYAWMNSAVRFGDTGTAGDIRRLGMYTVSGTTPQEGFYYELSGTTLNAVYVKAGSATAVASGSWSQQATAPFSLDTNYHSFQIRYTANTVQFIVDNVLRHSVSGTSSPLTTSLSLPIAATNVKTSGATDITLGIRNIGAGASGDPGLFQIEDFASSDSDRGIGSMAVRKATPANTSGSDGDYEFLQMSAGRLWTSAVIDTALPAGTNAIGKLAANSGVDIGALTANQTVNVAQINGVTTTMGNGASGTGVQRVTLASDSTGNIATIGTSVVPGTAATNLGKAEDAAHTTGDTGVYALAVRSDTPTVSSSTDGDYSSIGVGARGELWTGLVGHDTTTRISVATSALTTATTLYTAGDVLNGELSIANAVRIAGGRGVIEKVVAIDKSNNKAASLVELWFFQAASSPAADNAASSWADGNMDDHEGAIQLPSFTTGDSALNRAVTWIGAHPFQCASTTLFCVPITRTTHTAHFNAATDLVFKFQIRFE